MVPLTHTEVRGGCAKDSHIFTRVINCCWSLFLWGLFLTVVVAIFAGGYLYLKLDDEVCNHIERIFVNHYTQFTVDVGSARIEQGRGIFVNKLSIVEPRTDGRPNGVLSIDELFLASTARIDAILSGKPKIDRIVVRRPRLRAVRSKDGKWNVAALLPPPKFSDDKPDLLIEDATLILEDVSRHAVAPLSIRGIDLKLSSGELAAAGGRPGPRPLLINGTATGAPAREFTITGSLCPESGMLDLTVEIHGLELSPDLLAAVPGALPAQLPPIEFYAAADATIRLSRTAVGKPLAWSTEVALSRGRLDYEPLPQPLTDLSAKIHADSAKLVVENLTGKFGNADIAFALNRNGWAANSPLGLAGQVKGLVIDSKLEAALPCGLERLWHRFRPNGNVDAEVKLAFDGQRWQPELTAHCRGMSLTDADKFPYPIEQATGTVSLNRSPTTGATRLGLDLTGMGNGRPIHIVAELDHLALPKIPVANGAATVAFGDMPIDSSNGVQLASAAAPENCPLVKPTGWVQVSGEGVSIHEELLAALPPRAQPFVRSLRPQGLIDFVWRYERNDPNAVRGETSLQLKLADCAIQYERFPYPLQQVRGLVTARNARYTLSDIVGRDRQGSAVVTCQGESEMYDNGLAAALVITGTNVPLDENLKQSLNPQVQQVWTDLRPQGRINFTAHVNQQPGQSKPVVQVDLQPFERSVTVEPVFFPYRFEQVDGRAIVTDGRVELKQLQGKHGRTDFTADGLWQAAPGGGWHLQLERVTADRLAFEPDLMRAMLPGVQKVIDRIRPAGNFNVYNSTLQFARRSDTTQVAAAWDVQLACHQAALRGDLPLDNITGGIRVMGTADGTNAVSYGELKIDSLIWNDMQLTNISGPYWSDSNIVHLGSKATEKLGQPPRRINADVFGGTISSDVTVEHTGQPRYNAQIMLGGVDLGRVARERLGGPGDLKGIVSGTMVLNGTGRSTYALTGHGDLDVVDANIYQLPPLVAMLSVLRNRTPNTTAFDRCKMVFDLRGEHIHFTKLDLLGDAVSLYGRGETNFDRRLNLVFYTLVGPADLPIPLWKTVAGHLSEQGLQLKVDGTWDNPQIHREAFPAVSQMLEQIGAEAGAGASAVTPPASAGIPWLTPPR